MRFVIGCRLQDNRGYIRFVREHFEDGRNGQGGRNASVNEYALFIEEAGGMEKIFECQNNPNEKIYQKHLASLKSISLMTTVKSMTKTLFLKVTETHLVLGWTRINNNRTFSFRSGASFLFAVPFFIISV